jgi:hypothetical protein
MIRIDKQQYLPEVPEVTVWEDDKVDYLFYVLPASPRFRIQDGSPVFKFIKYRLPVDRPDGKKGGGFVFFDSEIVVPDNQMVKVTALLQDRVNKRHTQERRPGPPPKVQFGTITYTRGTVRLLLEENGVLIEKVRTAGKPSLYGRNVACFALELTPEGATVLEAAMQGQGASAVSVVYDLYFWVKLPPISAVVDFNSYRFYEYTKTVDIEVSGWDEDHYREESRQLLIDSQAGTATVNAEFTLPDPEADRKLKDRLREWAQRMLEDSLTRMAQQAAAEKDPGKLDTKKLFDKTLEDLGSDDLDNFEQVIREQKIVNFHYEFVENSATEWNLAPQGTLPTLTSLKDGRGQPIKWQDYALEIDANDPFFQQLNVNMQVNADFANLPLHSVELHLEYPHTGGRLEVAEYRFGSTNDAYRFTTFIDNNNQEYTYWYEVNYKAQARTFKSQPVKTNDRLLTVNIDDTGILNLDILTGDIDFDQVRVAQVNVRYPAGVGAPLAQQMFTIDRDHQSHRLQKVIFGPVDQPYEYTVKYVMSDGKEIPTGPVQDRAKPLIINDPFSEIRSVTVRASGDLQQKVQSIFVDLTYTDAKNNYHQAKSIALDANMPADEWQIPVILGSQGEIKYSGVIRYYDGTEDPIPETIADRPTILVGPSIRDLLEITVLPDFMFDNPDVRLVRVSLTYRYDGNGTSERKDFTFRPGDFNPGIWTVELKDKAKTEYSWAATFFLASGQKSVQGTTSDLTIIPQLPA